MKVPAINLLRPQEWLTLLSGIAVFAGIYAFLIHPSLDLCARHEAAFQARIAAEDELQKAREQLDQLRARVASDQLRLGQLGGSPPLASEKDLQISRITALANQCRLAVDQYLPIDTVDESDHQAAYVQFSGRTDYNGLKRYFERLEAELDFIDVTHFSLSSAQTGKGSLCAVNWSCRINGMRTDVPAPPTRKPAPPTEVASLEP